MLKRPSTKIKCVSDKFEYDNNNKVFYIYDLGRYKNQTIFSYGESYDISTTEFKLRKTVPIYKNIITQPVEHNVNSKDRFEEYLKLNKMSVKLLLPDTDDWAAFTTDDIRPIMQKINELFPNAYILS